MPDQKQKHVIINMRNLIPYILTASLTLVFSIAPTGDVFAQADQHVSDSTHEGKSTTPYVRGLTSARAKSLVGGVIGLLSLVIGWRTKARATSNAQGVRSWAMAALALGVIAIILSAVHLTNNTGAFGTGGGKAGAIVATVLGLAGATLSALALRPRPR
jgi:hypothetical protein